jgi:VanZ family protein
MLLIFAASAQPRVPDLLGGVSDKQMHAVAYAGLSTLACRAAAGGALAAVSPAMAVTGWAVATGYGALDEVHQAFVPGRSAEASDLVADASGAAVAAIGLWAWGIISRSRRVRRGTIPPA